MKVLILPLESHEFSSQQPTSAVTWIQFKTAHHWSHMNSVHNSPPVQSHEFSSKQPTSAVTWIQFKKAHQCSHMNSVQNSPPVESHEFSSKQPTSGVTWIQFTTAHQWSHMNSVHYSPPMESHEFSYYRLNDCTEQKCSGDANSSSAIRRILRISKVHFVFTVARHWLLTWAGWIQFKICNSICLTNQFDGIKSFLRS
jgi:hypothetical protein